MSAKTFLLIIGLLAITGGLFYVAVRAPAPAPPAAQTPSPIPTPVAQSQLLFGPLSSAPPPLTKLQYSLPINISTGTNKVTAVQLELQYDANLLSNVSISAGNFFENPIVLLNKIEQKTGRISYALGISPENSGKQGEGIAAILTFESKSKVPVQTTIQFLPKSLVTAEGISDSVLALTQPAQITVGK